MDTSKLLFEYLRAMFYRSEQASLDMNALPKEFQELGNGLQYLYTCIQETSALAQSLAKGELDYNKLPPAENEIAAPLKSLHASLRHLTWQTQQVAQGDYQQRVNFMGDYATAFNSMVEQLSQRRSDLIAEIDRNKQKVAELEQSNQLLATLARNIPNWIIVVDLETKQQLFTNHNIRQVLLDSSQDEMFLEWLDEAINYDRNNDLNMITELELPYENMTQILTVHMQPIHWTGKNAMAFLFTDVTAQRDQLKHLSDQAFYDVLTGLPNRRFSMALLEDWLIKKQKFCLCFIDIDNLKYVNDIFCHDQGDRYLQLVSDELQKAFQQATVSRIGGDEFMLMVPYATEADVKQQLHELRSELMNDVSQKYIQSFSYGVVSIANDNTLSAAELLRTADEHMYAFKSIYKSYHI